MSYQHKDKVETFGERMRMIRGPDYGPADQTDESPPPMCEQMHQVRRAID